METMSFGNLRDWGRVMEQLESLKREGRLGECQGELIRLLRFDQNWRLREAAIESLDAIENPGLDLARELLSIVQRKDLYYDVRILAVEALSHLTGRLVDCKDIPSAERNDFISHVIQRVAAHLGSPEPPKFHEALERSLDRIIQVRKAA